MGVENEVHFTTKTSYRHSGSDILRKVHSKVNPHWLYTSTMITGCTGLRVVLYELHFTVSGVTLHDGSGDGGRRPLCFVQVRWTSIGHCSGPARSGCNGFSCRGRLESHLDLLRQVHDLVSLGLPSLSRRGDSANGSCGGSGGG